MDDEAMVNVHRGKMIDNRWAAKRKGKELEADIMYTMKVSQSIYPSIKSLFPTVSSSSL
jgi:hypothetical protein